MFKKIFLACAFVIVSQLSFAQMALVMQDSLLTDVYKLEEVSIVSSKELHKIKALPAALSIISSNKIELNQISSIKNLSSFVPNLFMPDYGSRLTSPIYIRGIGSKIGTPSVGLYIDNIPYFEKSCFDFDFAEIDKIEVLRGPQGTLYGRNTMGGIINIHTKSPEFYDGSDFFISKGEYANTKIAASTYNRINEKISYSFASAFNHEGGFYMNESTGDKVDKLDSYNASSKIVYKISDAFKSTISLAYQGLNQGGYPYAPLDKSTNIVAPISYNRFSSYDRDIYSAALYNEFKNEKIILSSSTAYNFYNDAQNIDQDFSPLDMFFVNYVQDQHMISQEFTLKSRKDGMYKWLVGAFGFYQSVDASTSVTYYDDLLSKMHLKDYAYVKDNDTKTVGAALFHQSTFNFNRFSISAGIRIDYESTRLAFNYDKTVNSKLQNMDLFDSRLSYFEILPKTTIKYSFNDNNFLYASLAKGYKAGGFNSIIEDDSEKAYDPESSWNYELGAKTSLINNRLFVNFAAFYIDWTKQQITKTPKTGQGTILINAGESESMGLELDTRAIVLRNFEASISYGYTSAKFNKYVTSEKGVLVDYSDKFIPYIPNQTISLGLTYTKELKSSYLDEIRVNARYNGVGRHYWDIQNEAVQAFYYTVDTKISFVKRNLSVDLWAKNLTGSQYWAYYFAMGNSSFVQTSKPSQWGLSLKYSF